MHLTNITADADNGGMSSQLNPSLAVVGLISCACATAGILLKNLPGFSLIGSLMIALILGLCCQYPLQKIWLKKHAEPSRAAASWLANRLLRAGIILLGCKLNLQVLFSQGLTCLPLAALEVTIMFTLTFWLARLCKVPTHLAVLTAGGTSICGAAAVMGLSGAVGAGVNPKTRTHHEVTAVAIVAIMGTVFCLLDIMLLPHLGFTASQQGMVAGLSLHEIAHSVAAGNAVDAVDQATIMKLSRVLMLAPAALIVGWWWTRRANTTTGPTVSVRKLLPWFMLGFIAASILGTLLPQLQPAFTPVVPVLVNFGYLLLGTAMAALGLNVNLKGIAAGGLRAVLASFLASLVLLAGSILVVSIWSN